MQVFLRSIYDVEKWNCDVHVMSQASRSARRGQPTIAADYSDSQAVSGVAVPSLTFLSLAVLTCPMKWQPLVEDGSPDWRGSRLFTSYIERILGRYVQI